MAEPNQRRRSSIAARIVLAACGLVIVAVCATLALADWLGDPLLGGAIAMAALVPVTYFVVRRPLGPALAMFRALAGTVTSYRDGDFAFSLAWKKNDEVGDLVEAHNALGDTLRDQRLALVQRELLLDTMLQN